MISKIQPQELSGSIEAIPSKSMAHRMLILASLARDISDIDCAHSSEDIEATKECLVALGARITKTKRGFRVVPIGYKHQLTSNSSAASSPLQKPTELNCHESGSTLRFMLAISAALGRHCRFFGEGRLGKRPLLPLIKQLKAHGSTFSKEQGLPLDVSGRLLPGKFIIEGNISSQFISAILLAASILNAPSEIWVKKPVESRPYIDMTCQALSTFGVSVNFQDLTYQAVNYCVYRIVPPKEGLKARCPIQIEGDWSNSAFWLAAAAIGSTSLSVTGLTAQSLQADRAILPLLSRFGAKVAFENVKLTVCGKSLCAQDIDISAFPDLCAPLAAVAACSQGTSRLLGASRLRLKESDRLNTISSALKAMGVACLTEDDTLLIKGTRNASDACSLSLMGGTVDAARDHRIAMMAAILATQAQGSTEILGSECVAKSYPRFFEDFASLGGIYTHISDTDTKEY